MHVRVETKFTEASGAHLDLKHHMSYPLVDEELKDLLSRARQVVHELARYSARQMGNVEGRKLYAAEVTFNVEMRKPVHIE